MVFATDPDIKNCLSKDEVMSPDDLERGYDVFLCIPEDMLEQWKGLMTLIISQFMKHFERRARGENATPILFLIDEWARVGKLPNLLDGLSTLRDRAIVIALICQSLAQPELIYGGKEIRRAIMDNIAYIAVLKATDAETQEYFSKLVGTWDKPYKSNSVNYSEIMKLPTGTSISIKPEEKRIIKPEEFATLTDMVLLTPYGFMRAEKLPYYEHSAFNDYVEQSEL